MKRFTLLARTFLAIILLSSPFAAQDLASLGTLREQIKQLEKIDQDMALPDETRTLNNNFLKERRGKLRAMLQKRIDSLRQYQTMAGSVLTAKELQAVDDSIQNLTIELKGLAVQSENMVALVATVGTPQEILNTDSLEPMSRPVTLTNQSVPGQITDSDDDEDDRGLLQRLADKGYSLQRAITGDNATEGASFSFLRTFKAKTVYATEFALIWNPPGGTPTFGNTAVSPEFSLEGSLTSDESEAEDAWRLRAAAQFRTTFDTKRLSGMRNYLGGKFEASQDFTTKKLMFQYLITPTWVKAGIGQYLGRKRKKDPISFRWRPYFEFNAGHTFKAGRAEKPEQTILRFVPRLRAEFRLNFIDWILKSHRTLLYADNTFYYLPLENGGKTPNYLVSGLEVGFNKNVGLGFTYRNGKSSPKFERVHTFGGEFTIRFGKSAQ